LATGAQVTGRANCSTTGLLGIDGHWDDELVELLGLPARLFVEPGTDLGPVLPDLVSKVGMAGQPHVSTVGSQDTSSAVVAVPMAADRAVYISCGTWGQVGVELDRPVLTEAARSANFTNEVGAGPVEATAIGNVPIQARGHTGDLEPLRANITDTVSVDRYMARGSSRKTRGLGLEPLSAGKA